MEHLLSERSTSWITLNMPKLTVLDAKGKKVGTYSIELTDLAPRINKQLAARRSRDVPGQSAAGVTHDQEPWHGAWFERRSCTGKKVPATRVLVRGAVVFVGVVGIFTRFTIAIIPIRLPRKALQLATRMAIASKIEDDQITLIDKLEFAEPKTARWSGCISIWVVRTSRC